MCLTKDNQLGDLGGFVFPWKNKAEGGIILVESVKFSAVCVRMEDFSDG